jgi:hypothetical protein
MDKIIDLIMNDVELSEKEKSILVKKIVMSSHGINRFITPEYFFHTEKKKDGSIDMQLWYRSTDENDNAIHGNTNWSSRQIVEFMKKEYFTLKKGLKKKL